MIIKTKYDIGDIIWFMFNNKTSKSKIENIYFKERRDFSFKGKINKNEITNNILYTPNNNTGDIPEQRCFSSENDLLNSLRKNKIPNYKKGFEEVMCYFDSISDEEKPKLSKKLKKLGL